MNIFAVSEDPILCAQALDDKRLVKMLTETAQLLCAARVLSGKPAPYKASHPHHPATKWAMAKFQNRCWLGALGCAYYNEYRMRYGKSQHMAWEKCGELFVKYRDEQVLHYDLTFVNCARHQGLDADYTHMRNVHAAYRCYLIHRWTLALNQDNPHTIPTFTNRKPPEWSGELALHMRMK